MSESLKYQLENESNGLYNPRGNYKKNMIDNQYLIPYSKEGFEDSLKDLETGSACSRYSSYMTDLKIIKNDLGEAHKKFQKARTNEIFAEEQKQIYLTLLKRSEDGLNLTPAETDLLNQTSPVLMEKYLSEFKTTREKCQTEKTRLADLVETMEVKSANLRTKHGASLIFEDSNGTYKRKFTSAAAGVLQPNKRSKEDVALSLIQRFTTEKLLKLDFDKGLSLIKEYRDTWAISSDMHYLYSMIASNMESSRNTIDRLGMSKMLFEGLNKERQVDYSRTIATLMAVTESSKEMKKPALKSRREKDEQAKKVKEVKTKPKPKPFHDNNRGRVRGRGRGRGNNSYRPRKEPYFDQEKAAQPTEKPEKINSGHTEGFRGRGRGGFRGGRGSKY